MFEIWYNRDTKGKGVRRMNQQMNLSDLEYSNRKRITKREQFLDCMDEITPWDEIVEMIRPYYYKNKVGRPPRGIETMFRMYLL